MTQAQTDGPLPPAGDRFLLEETPPAPSARPANPGRAWVIWAASLVLALLLTRNPLYISLIAMSAWLVLAARRLAVPDQPGWAWLLGWSAVAGAIAMLYGVLTLHAGSHVLVSLPDRLPFVGGAVTIEGVVGGATWGLTLWSLALIYTTLYAVVTPLELVRLLPAFVCHLGAAPQIALLFVPQLVAARQRLIRARYLRGLPRSRWGRQLGDLGNLCMEAYEQSLAQVAALDARGLGHMPAPPSHGQIVRYRGQMLLGLLLLLTGIVLGAYWPSLEIMQIGIVVIAALFTLSILQQAGRMVRRTTYGDRRWRTVETLIAACGLIPLAMLILLHLMGNDHLAYSPHTGRTAIPEFNPWIGIVLSIAALPGVMELFASQNHVPADVADQEGAA